MARTPTRIGRYDLIAALATGGMGRIYLGRATGIGGFERKVVIKTLEVPLTADSDPAIAMFLDEARLLALLHHQHIASVFEVGRDDDGRHYMVLDYVEGHSAHDVWERAVQFTTALPLDFTLTVVSAAANGLHYTHTRREPDGSSLGIVHRDVTPSNVMIGHDGAVKLIDFGIAMAANRMTKTQTGFVKGKVSYLSPEQVSGHDVDARTDVFALGILLYELSTLERAFRDSTDLETMQRIKAGKLVRPSKVIDGYPRELEAIVLKALQVDPRDRFSDADAMRRAVEAFGHRERFVLGDAAVIEVMAQLFEPSALLGAAEPPQRPSDPEFEWVASDHDLTVRRDPKELIEAMRAVPEGREHDATGRLVTTLHAIGMKPRKLRAATEVADALIVQSIDVPPLLPLASPPPTPETPRLLTSSAVASPGAPRGGRSLVAGAPVTPVEPTATTETPAPQMIGASLVQARMGRRRLPWLAAIVVALVVAAAGYFATRGEPRAKAGSTAPLVVPSPAAARAPAAPPPAAKPAPAPAPPVAPPAAKAAPLVAPPAAKAAPAPPAGKSLPAAVPPAVPARPAPARSASAPTVGTSARTATPTARIVPAEVRVQIVTRPADATVYLDGKRLGRTPLDERVPSDSGSHVVKIKRRGYAMARVDVELTADVHHELTLSPQK